MSRVRGALYTTGDGFINAKALTRALAKGAEKGGATVVEECPPFKIIAIPNDEWVVQLEDGREIRTRNIVNAAGKRSLLAFSPSFFSEWTKAECMC